ncbi:hypothetical protein O4J56_31900 [Nocardiopsis sp. RSe5-2]|uniref:Uncharacterized protein n=1 Tax=Nocardiopsis endophytica TaxID=3018445 RepID=A0ABT4UE79_9ACTN|nr:hypothetical protein [Nocardiopsis endophytica]MDA2815289.1 hypothetical protein [Nocardiopsis endophytica]
MTERTARLVLVLAAGALLVGGLALAGALPVSDGSGLGVENAVPLAAIDVGLSPALVGGP